MRQNEEFNKSSRLCLFRQIKITRSIECITMLIYTHTYQTLCTQEAQEQARKDAEARRKKIEALRVTLDIPNQMHSV